MSLKSHRPVLLAPDLISAHDLLVAMEYQQMEHLRSVSPASASRVELLPLFDAGATGHERYKIDDPFMRQAPAYAEGYRRLDRAVAARCDGIARRATVPGNLERRC